MTQDPQGAANGEAVEAGDLLPLKDGVFVGRDLEGGKKMFALASCYGCFD